MNIKIEKSRIPAHLLKYFETSLCGSCYICHTIEILREIKRVLRKDGVVFWNIGDTYATHASGGNGYAHNFRTSEVAIREGIDQPKPTAKSIGLKEKDLCLIPFRIAIAAQEDGWWVRSDIIWSKNNPMPESVTDRPTNSHEYILMLTKSAHYYWDAEAVREAYTEPMNRWGGETLKRDTSKTAEYKEMQNIGYSSAFRVGIPMRPNESGRNLRSVWTFPTQPYPEAHFATFPEALPERCIKAATPEAGCCAECGAPYTRILGNPQKVTSGGYGSKTADECGLSPSSGIRSKTWTINDTLGWRPSCKCGAPAMPSIVLDPFAGSGTTLWVAKKLNRRAVGYEISEEYCRLIIDRNRQQVIL